jgi:UDP-N-acetylmuramate dehydrogenase
MHLVENYSLKEHNTFGVEAHCRYFIEIKSTDELKDAIASRQLQENKVLLLGGGSNILFTQDFDGIILKIAIPGIHVVKEDEKYFWVKSGAGVLWHDLVKSCVEANFGGIENLSLIPGTVGAAPIQNIGAYGSEISQVIEAVEAYNLKTGEKKYFANKDCEFGYRDSIFKNELKGKYILTHIALRLLKEPVINLNYSGLKEKIEEINSGEITIKDVSDAIIQIRNSKLPDPEKIGNAGSFFKNPVISVKHYKRLKSTFEALPGYPVGDEHMKVPAAWLIEKAGWKGKHIGDAAVHKDQALVIVNLGSATGREILELSNRVQESVKSLFDIILEKEVQII